MKKYILVDDKYCIRFDSDFHYEIPADINPLDYIVFELKGIGRLFFFCKDSNALWLVSQRSVMYNCQNLSIGALLTLIQ